MYTNPNLRGSDNDLSFAGNIRAVFNDARRLGRGLSELVLTNLDTGINMSSANKYNSKVDDVNDIMNNSDNCYANADAYEKAMSQKNLTERQKRNLKARMDLYDAIGAEATTVAKNLR